MIGVIGLLKIAGLVAGLLGALGAVWWVVDSIGDKREMELRLATAERNAEALDNARREIARLSAINAERQAAIDAANRAAATVADRVVARVQRAASGPCEWDEETMRELGAIQPRRAREPGP